MKTSREDLLVVAFRLFVSKGYAQTSMVDLARESGVSKGAFHHYFPRKIDVFDASIAHFFSNFLPSTELDNKLTFEDFARKCGRDYATVLSRVLDANIPLAAYQAFLWSLIRDEPQKFQKLHVEMIAKADALFARQISDTNKSESAAEVARALVATIEGTGNALCLNANAKREDIKPAFDAAITDFLARIKS